MKKQSLSGTMILIFLLGMCATAFAETLSENETKLKEADNTFNSRKYAEATELYKELVLKAEQEKDIEILVQALAMVARGYLIQDKKEEGRPWLKRAGELASEKEPKAWTRYLGVKGRFEWRDDDKPAATKTFEAMYEFSMEHEQYSRAIDAAHMVAITGTFEQQIEWAHRGIKAAEEGEIDGWLGPLWNNLGASYWDMTVDAGSSGVAEYNKEALECYLKAREYHWKVGRERNKLLADWAVGSAYRRTGDNETARAWLRPVLAWGERIYALDPTPDNAEWVAWPKWDLGLIADEEGDYEFALEYLSDAKEKLGAIKMEEWDKKTWDDLCAKVEELNDRVK